jgi:predicted nucleic-acid-binding protein
VIGIDTNVLIRFLTDDDHAQALAAKRLLEARTAADPAYVSQIVLVEALWVLRSSYGLSAADANSLVAKLAAIDTLRFEKPKLVEQALQMAEEDGFDLPDVLIALSNGQAGCGETRTLDRRAARIPGMALLEA